MVGPGLGFRIVLGCKVETIFLRAPLVHMDSQGQHLWQLTNMHVNKALHTCTSRYAYAAMFGSSTACILSPSRALVYVQSIKLHSVVTFNEPSFVGQDL